jgi:soluble cytochrome b562
MNTLWQRITFNAKEQTYSDETEPTSLKETFSDLINKFDEIRNSTEEQDVKRLASITISKLEEACMFGVKTLTYDK